MGWFEVSLNDHNSPSLLFFGGLPSGMFPGMGPPTDTPSPGAADRPMAALGSLGAVGTLADPHLLEPGARGTARCPATWVAQLVAGHQ